MNSRLFYRVENPFKILRIIDIYILHLYDMNGNLVMVRKWNTDSLFPPRQRSEEKRSMEKFVYIKTSWCPYCRMAEGMIKELKAENSAYRTLEMEVIDEDQNPTEAGKYKYRLVPNYWIGDKKVFEGVPSKQALKKVLDEVLEKSLEAEEIETEDEDEDGPLVYYSPYSC